MPRTWLGWTRFAIETFDALLESDDVALAGESPDARDVIVVAECFPTATWRTAGLTPLPGAARCDASTLRERASALWRRFGLPGRPPRALGHDDLQAVVCALVGAALTGGPGEPVARGEPIRALPGAGPPSTRRVEGWIWDVVAPRTRS